MNPNSGLGDIVKIATILIVEDDQDLSGNIALILRMEGFHVIVAANGKQGLEVIQKLRPDLILCDILMPEVDGFAFHQKVKEDEQFSGVPFIFISALNDHQHMRRGMQAGADDYLCKPFSAEELVAAVTTRLQRFALLFRANEKIVLTREQIESLKNVSQRELQILAMVAEGATTKDIAIRLCISPKTVEVHRSRLMKKLNASNAVMLVHWAQLADFAIRNKLIHMPYGTENVTVSPTDDNSIFPGCK